MRVAVRVDEDLEVVVVEYDGVPLLELGPDVGFLHLRRYVKEVIVPEHLDPGGETGRRQILALDVDELVGPWRRVPGRLVDAPVDVDGDVGLGADVVLRWTVDRRFGEHVDRNI